MPIDKTQLYQMFEKSLRRNQRLGDLSARKALDLPLDDDMQIITNNSRSGLGIAGTLLLSAGMLISGTAGGFALMHQWNRAASEDANANAQPSQLPESQEFKITFWTEDGESLEVQEDE